MANNTYKLQFTMSDGSTVDAGNLVVPQGPTGATGDKGDTGARGKTIFSGTSAPSASSVSGAVNGDYFIDTANLKLYNYNGSTWSLTGSLKGNTGATGAKGDKGATGAKGDHGVNVTGATLTLVS